MLLSEALKSGRRIRNLKVMNGVGFEKWCDPKDYGFGAESVLSEDWEVQEPKCNTWWIVKRGILTPNVYSTREQAQHQIDRDRGLIGTGLLIEVQEIPPGAKVLTKDMIDDAWPFYDDVCASYLPLLLKNLGFDNES